MSAGRWCFSNRRAPPSTPPRARIRSLRSNGSRRRCASPRPRRDGLRVTITVRPCRKTSFSWPSVSTRCRAWAKVEEDTKTGLYLYDRFGNLELLYRKDGISSMYPIRWRPGPRRRSSPARWIPASATRRIPSGQRAAEPFSATGVAAGAELTSTRSCPERDPCGQQPRIGYANAESARMLLGTVPVEEDGSAYFRARETARVSGRGCGRTPVRGCGRTTSSPANGGAAWAATNHQRGGIRTRLLAAMRAPSTIAPGPDGTRPWSFPG